MPQVMRAASKSKVSRRLRKKKGNEGMHGLEAFFIEKEAREYYSGIIAFALKAKASHSTQGAEFNKKY